MACPKIESFEDCKDVDADLPYTFDWSAWTTDEATVLVDNVANYAITIVLVDEDETDTTPLVVGTVTVDVAESKIHVWLSAGTAGLKYYIDCKVIAANGMTEEKSGILTCVERK